LQRTAASPLAGMCREPAKVLVGEGVLPAPPLPLKPTVGRQRAAKGGQDEKERVFDGWHLVALFVAFARVVRM